MPLTRAEREIWENVSLAERIDDDDHSINQKYSDGEGRIVVESNREKLPSFVEQLRKPKFIDLSPFYQRRPRWDRQRQSRLIESFLLNIPVPPIFLYEKSYNSFEVMDGQQRITAVKDFYENKFELQGMQYWPELNGRYYHNLPSIVRSGIDRRSISSIVMLKESAPREDEALALRQIVFERLNTGGIELERQEIRHALYQGPFNEMLEIVSRADAMRRAWGLPLYHPDELQRADAKLLRNKFFSKMEDHELVLRFFALRSVDKYRSGMQGFLDLFMMRAATLSSGEVGRLANLFMETLHLAEAIYGDRIFRPYLPDRGSWSAKPQKAFYDAVMVALSDFVQQPDLLIDRRSGIVSATRAMFADNPPGTFTGRGNSKRDIQNRVELFRQMIIGVIG